MVNNQASKAQSSSLAYKALVWFCTNTGHLIMVLLRASLKLLLRLARMFADPRNRKAVVFILTALALSVLSKLLVNRANRKRLKQSFRNLF